MNELFNEVEYKTFTEINKRIDLLNTILLINISAISIMEQDELSEIIEFGKFNIVGFGDSLTRGFYDYGAEYHPYSIKLNSLINDNNIKYKCNNFGFNGMSSNDMPSILEEIIAQLKNIEVKFFIVYAGTNDIMNQNCNIKKFEGNIKKLHELILNFKSKMILLTLSSNIIDMELENYTKRRNEMNDFIRKYCDENKLILCDLDKEISYLKFDDVQRDKYWDDHLHFKPKGYDLIAEVIFKNIRNQLIE